MNRSKAIIKRIYLHQNTFSSINVLPDIELYPDQTFQKIPKCANCIYFSRLYKTCNIFFFKIFVARLDQFNCGFYGNYFKLKL